MTTNTPTILLILSSEKRLHQVQPQIIDYLQNTLLLEWGEISYWRLRTSKFDILFKSGFNLENYRGLKFEGFVFFEFPICEKARLKSLLELLLIERSRTTDYILSKHVADTVTIVEKMKEVLR